MVKACGANAIRGSAVRRPKGDGADQRSAVQADRAIQAQSPTRFAALPTTVPVSRPAVPIVPAWWRRRESNDSTKSLIYRTIR